MLPLRVKQRTLYVCGWRKLVYRTKTVTCGCHAWIIIRGDIKINSGRLFFAFFSVERCDSKSVRTCITFTLPSDMSRFQSVNARWTNVICSPHVPLKDNNLTKVLSKVRDFVYYKNWKSNYSRISRVHFEGRVAKWFGRRTWNPVIPSPALSPGIP